MNTMEFNKLFGAVTAALLIYLLANFVSESLYELEEPKKLAYALEIEGADEAEAEEEPETPFPVVLASADVAAGEKVFKKCSACHKLEDGANAVGPHLWGVVGRDVGAVADYGYSGALSEVADVWTFENLNGFLENPKGWAPGTSMGFAGLNKPEDRAAVIVYLNAEGGSNLPLPEVAEEEPAEEAVTEAEPAPAATEEMEMAAAAPEAVADDGEAEAAADEAAAEDVATEEDPATDAEVAAATANALADAVTHGESAAAAATEMTFAEALQEADVAYGEEIFQSCAACHMLAPGAHGIGPSLAGVLGADIAGADNYPYSDALSAIGGTWTLSRLNVYLTDPAAAVEGVKMGFAGLERQVDRAAVIAYLNTQMAEPLSLEISADDAADFTPASEEEEAAAEAETMIADAVDTVEETAVEMVETAEETAAETLETASDAAAPVVADVEDAAEAVADESEAVADAVAETAEPVVEAVEEAAADTVDAVAETAETIEEEALEMAAASPAEDPAPAAASPASSVDPEFVAAYMAADLKDGGKVFRQCKACHKLEEGKNAVGPSLWGVVGRDIGAIDGFKYSDALATHGGAWNFETLNGYLENPKEYIPGNRMGYRGLKKLEDRAAVIKYLNEEGGSNVAIQ